MTDLAYRHKQIVSLIQASLGKISRNMRLISVVPKGKGATLLFLLEEESAEDREEIEEIASRYLALQDYLVEQGVDASINVIGNREIVKGDDYSGLLVYRRKRE